MTTTCACGATLGRKNTSGNCRSCTVRRMNADPEVSARRAAAIKARTADPEVRARMSETMRRVVAELTPEQIERRREHGRRQVREHLFRPEAVAKALSPETRARAGRARTATVLAWCPEEWRDTYLDLTRKGRRAADAKRIVLGMMAGAPLVRFAKQKAQLAWCPQEHRQRYQRLRARHGAAEAKRLLLEELAAAEERRLAAMSAVERQTELMIKRIQAGATIVHARPVPTRTHAFTLGGVASGML